MPSSKSKANHRESKTSHSPRRGAIKSKFENRESRILLGAHMSIGGGIHQAIERACSIGCSAMQIFVKNNMQWFARPITREEVLAFCKHAQRAELRSVFAHAN